MLLLFYKKYIVFIAIIDLFVGNFLRRRVLFEINLLVIICK